MFLATLLATAAVAAPRPSPPPTSPPRARRSTGRSTQPATVYFEYGTTTIVRPDSTHSRRRSPGPVSATISGLTAETTYHYRIVVDGVAQDDATFTTAANPQAARRSPTSGRATSRPDSATATASIDTERQRDDLPHRVRHHDALRQRDHARPGARAPAPARSPSSSTDLRPYTRYHWRTVATNAAGTTRGADRSFRTARLPSAVSLGSRARPSRGAATCASAAASAAPACPA